MNRFQRFNVSLLILCIFGFLTLISSFPSPRIFNSLLPSTQLIFSTPSPSSHKRFRLKHLYEHKPNGEGETFLRRLDVHSAVSFYANNEPPAHAIKIKTGSVRRPKNRHAFRDVRTTSHFKRILAQTEYTRDEFAVLPDPSDRNTILEIAKMTFNAYNNHDEPILARNDKWYDLGDRWRLNSSFGWGSDGVRGHVFGDENASTLFIAIKGTSASFLGGGDTSARDKLNDNLLFSCCCGRVDTTWHPVCDCYKDSYTCDENCLETSLDNKELYYAAAMHIFFDVVDKYPDADIWLTGHSLGGSLAALLGLTFGLPTITFETPGDKLAAQRLHLPMPPAINGSDVPIWHFGHTADPVFMGVCTGPTSSCYYGGYAMESKCHTGKVCVYDVVADLGWRLDIRSHRIADVIERVLKKYDKVPTCVEDTECEDCGMWKFPEY
ncbi:uncharacterized protein VTP21DRAFT_661 [Calcarisporiella thermophila]|uniref:uncharacterized protein n=1 Tax=Calcarisporiella thermophila TaxID=911321 RepID=UPI003744036B